MNKEQKQEESVQVTSHVKPVLDESVFAALTTFPAIDSNTVVSIGLWDYTDPLTPKKVPLWFDTEIMGTNGAVSGDCDNVRTVKRDHLSNKAQQRVQRHHGMAGSMQQRRKARYCITVATFPQAGLLVTIQKA